MECRSNGSFWNIHQETSVLLGWWWPKSGDVGHMLKAHYQVIIKGDLSNCLPLSLSGSEDCSSFGHESEQFGLSCPLPSLQPQNGVLLSFQSFRSLLDIPFTGFPCSYSVWHSPGWAKFSRSWCVFSKSGPDFWVDGNVPGPYLRLWIFTTGFAQL